MRLVREQPQQPPCNQSYMHPQSSMLCIETGATQSSMQSIETGATQSSMQSIEDWGCI